MATRTVLTDTYCWMTPLQGQPGKYEHNTAPRGAVIEITDLEAARGDKLGALGSPEAFDAEEAAKSAAGVSFVPATDEAIEAMTVAEIHAYLNQVPEDQRADHVARIVDLEDLRETPRAGIIKLMDASRPAGPTFTPATDEAIEAMTVAEIHAYLNQVPEDRRADQVARIVDLEDLRETPRPDILELAE